MSRETLTAESRDASGKTPVARRLRAAGKIPGVLYGGENIVPFAVEAREATALLRHGATIVDVDIDGTRHTSVIKDYQVHPVRGTLQHLDLQEVRMDETIKTVASLQLTGDAPGVTEGGVLDQVIFELTIESVPGDIPETLELDVSQLGVGEHLSIADIKAPSGVTFLDDPETVVVSVTAPSSAPVEPAEAAEEAAGAEAQASQAAGQATDNEG